MHWIAPMMSFCMRMRCSIACASHRFVSGIRVELDECGPEGLNLNKTVGIKQRRTRDATSGRSPSDPCLCVNAVPSKTCLECVDPSRFIARYL